jgi:hypothetical protein
MPIADPTHAIYASKADAEAYQAKVDAAAGLPRLEGVPGGDDPTGRRAMYPAQRVTEHLDSLVEASDKSAYAYPLDAKVDPGKNATKTTLADPKWTAKEAVSAALAEDTPTMK